MSSIGPAPGPVAGSSGGVSFISSRFTMMKSLPVSVRMKCSRVFIASAGDPELNPNERNGALIALDATSGNEIWRGKTQLPLFATPVIVADSIVVAMNSQDVLLELAIFDLTDLDSSWTFTPPDDEGGQ